ncbi:hypothetical protein KR067_001290 [Drosophila pandora]|nr:hypothetical protein KR067_001290 [Drosophila pandora]
MPGIFGSCPTNRLGPHLLQISRCLSYHVPLFRPRSILQARKLSQLCCSVSSRSRSGAFSPANIRVQPYSQKGTSVFTYNDNVDMSRKRVSFSGASEKKNQLLPVGLITPESDSGKQVKIVVVPLDLSTMDANTLKETLDTINQLRLYANHIEDFSNTMMEEYNALSDAMQEVEETTTELAEVQQELERARQEINSENKQFWESLNATPLSADLDAVADRTNFSRAGMGLGRGTPMEERQEAVSSCLQAGLAQTAPMTAEPRTAVPNFDIKSTSTLPHALRSQNPTQFTAFGANLNDPLMRDDFIEEVRVDVPKDMSSRLNELAVSSMELSFEMDMTNLKDALANPHTDNANLQDPMICMHTKVEMDAPGTVENTVPLRFNALISGVVELDTEKLNAHQITDEKMPGFNDDLTSLAANLCSTALEKGFSSSSSNNFIGDLEMTKNEEMQKDMLIDTSLMHPAAHVGHVAQEMMAAVVPDVKEEVEGKDGCKHPPVKPKKKCPGKCPLITDPCKEDPCKRPEKTKKPPKKKASSALDVTAQASGDKCDKKKKDPCAKKKSGGKKKDPCAKDGGKGGKKKDPCAKFKKGKDKKKDPCAKKKDPCAKKEKKKDPCAKKEKKKDPCAKKDKKKDPCAKKEKKKDPCAKKEKKKDPCAKKEKKKDPCAKKDKGKKKDPCAKKGDKGGKKKDPCAKFKKGGKDKKKDPCAKKGGKGGKKEDPCAKFKKNKGGKDKGCKFSTYAPNDFNKRYLSTVLGQTGSPRGPRFQVYSTRVRRNYRIPTSKNTPCQCPMCQGKRLLTDTVETPARFVINSSLMRRRFGSFSGMDLIKRSYSKKKKKKAPGKCGSMAQKYPKSRGKDQKERTGLRLDCFKSDDDCTIKGCSGHCAKVKFPRKKCEKKKKKKSPKKSKAKKSKKDKKGCGKGKKSESFSTRSACQIKPDLKPGLNGKAYAVRIPNPYKIDMVPVSRPTPTDFDVLVRTSSVAISGSDIHVYERGNSVVESITLGHDATGFVEEVGRSVRNLRVGDRVVMESALSCGICDLCKRGQYNMCCGMVYNGFLATHQTHPGDLCHRLYPSISMDEGTLVETLALGCQACLTGNVTPTSNVLIIGACPTAVSAGLCAKALGTKRVVIGGPSGKALEAASRDFGFDTVPIEENSMFGEVLEAMYCKFHDWPDRVINCSISALTMNLAVMALQPCGICVLAECGTECASFNALDVLMKNIRLIPSFRSANMYPTALQLMKSGRAPMHKFIAGTFPLSHAEEAFRTAQEESNEGLGKVIVNCADETGLEASQTQKTS